MKIRERIIQVSGAEFGELGNVYVISYKSGYIMIDAGMPSALNVIKDNLKYWGIEEEKITHIFVTHAHDDHCGCCAYFQKKGTKICIGAEDAKMMKAGNLGINSPCTNHVMPQCNPDIEIGNEEIFEFKGLKLYTYKMPGHTDGTVVYYAEIDQDKVLFTGDFFFPYGERGEFASTGWKGDLSYSPEKMTQSFSRLYDMKLNVNLVLSGHGIPLFGEKAQDLTRVAFKYHILNNR
mgnify:CR=1 FL=1